MEFVKIVGLGANAVVLIYYMKKYHTLHSLSNYIENATQIEETGGRDTELHTLVNQNVIVRGEVKPLNDPIASFGAPALKGVIQVYQTVVHRIRQIAGFWVRKREESIHVLRNHILFALTSREINRDVIITDPTPALELASRNDLFTGHHSVTWPNSSIVHETFTPAEIRNDIMSKLFGGVQDVGFHRTESMILNGSCLTAIGELQMRGNQIVLLPDLLSLCDQNLLLEKLDEIKADVGLRILRWLTFGFVFYCTMRYFSGPKRRRWSKE